jgi:hypothetical protein
MMQSGRVRGAWYTKHPCVLRQSELQGWGATRRDANCLPLVFI